MTILPVQAKVTKTAIFTPANSANIDISGITSDWTLCIQVAALSPAGAQATFQFQDSVNDFTASITGPSESVLGVLTSSNDVVLKVKKYMFPRMRFGVTSAVLRLALVDITGSASVTYSAWIEY